MQESIPLKRERRHLLKSRATLVESKTPIAFIDIRFSAHATEDPEKVKKAVYNLLPENLAEGVVFTNNVVSGHHGNPIILFGVRIKDGELIKAFIDKLSTNLSDLDKAVLSGESSLVVEKSNLYLRLDKQAALEDEFKLQKADPIHIRIHFKRKDEKSIVETCRELGLMT
jgi:RNA binding exosome subunit